MNASLTLDITSTGTESGWALLLQVTEATGMSPYIFAISRGVEQSGDPATVTDRFSHVCSMSDLETYPDKTQTADTNYYRESEVTLVFPNQQDLDRVRALIVEDIQFLVDSVRSSDKGDKETLVF